MISINKDVCIKCNLCLTSCPQFLLKREPEGVVLINETDCDNCMECAKVCPVEAIIEINEEEEWG